MNNSFKIFFLLLASVFMIVSCNSNGSEDTAKNIISMERNALDRWGRGDPWGFAEIYADEITYFSPGTERRIDGIDSMKAAFKRVAGKILINKYDWINPKVQVHGKTAILTFNHVDHISMENGNMRESHWNCTEVYTKIGDDWKIVHSHWSRPPTNHTIAQEEDI